MSMQQRDRGMISQGIGREIIQTIEPIVLSQVSMREPIKLSTTFFVFCTQSFISSRSWLRYLIPWEWKGMAVKIRIGEAIHFWKSYFDVLGKLSPRNECLFHYSPPFLSSSCSWSLVYIFLHIFLVFSSFFPYPEICFCIAE